MSGKASDAGKAFLAGVLAKISDPEKRAQVEAAFNDPSAADALVLVGTGALAQTDINRRYDELKAKEETLTEDYTKLNAWYAEKKDQLDEYGKLKAGGNNPPLITPPIAPPPFDDSKFVSREEFTKTMQQEQLAAANYLGLQNGLTLKHYKDFGEVLDTRELLADKNLGKQKSDGATYGLMDAYQSKFSEKLTARDQALEADRINKLVDVQVAERMKGVPNQPFPVRGGLGSPLDALDATGTPDPNQYSAAAAAAEYDRLQQTRQSS